MQTDALGRGFVSKHTMSHDLSYGFLCMGRNMERTGMTTRVIHVCATNLLPNQSWRRWNRVRPDQ